MTDQMTAADLVALRKSWDITQTDMAARLGLSLRAYQDVESGKATLRPLHVKAVERAALDIAIERRNPMLAPPAARRAALALARLLDEG